VTPLLDPHVSEPGVLEQRRHLCAVGQAPRTAAVAVGRGVAHHSPDRRFQGCERRTALDRSPNRGPSPPAGPHDTAHFGDGPGAVREELQSLLAGHHVVGLARRRQRGSRALQVLDGRRAGKWGFGAGYGQHGRAQVAGGHVAGWTDPHGSEPRDRSGARRDIQQRFAWAHLQLSEQYRCPWLEQRPHEAVLIGLHPRRRRVYEGVAPVAPRVVHIPSLAAGSNLIIPSSCGSGWTARAASRDRRCREQCLERLLVLGT
jgi:hypothetical protein